MNFFKTTLLFAIFLSMLATSACKKEIKGCTDPDSLNFDATAEVDDGNCIYLKDKVVGDWNAVKFSFSEEDIITLYLYTVIFEFKSNGDFKWTGINGIGDTIIGIGGWSVDGNFLDITLQFGSATFCEDAIYQFSIDFDGDDALKLEGICDDDIALKFEFDKK